MTGRAAGYCAGYDTAGFANPVAARGTGGGRGRGGCGRGAGGGGGRSRGWRNMFRATGLPGWMRREACAASPADEPETDRQALKAQADALQAQLELIRKRLDALETKPASE